jgi:hypothetical protein
MREWSTFGTVIVSEYESEGTCATIIKPECESGAHYIGYSNQNKRGEHMLYENRARMQERGAFGLGARGVARGQRAPGLR